MPPQFLELGLLLLIILLASAGVVLWLQSQKKRMHPMLQVLALILLVGLLLTGIQYGSNALGVTPSASSTGDNPFRQALRLLNDSYPTYTNQNNVNGVNREVLVKRFQDMEKLELEELKAQVTIMRGLIEDAPSSGQVGIYNMRMTSGIQARWDELRQALQKRAQ